MQLNDNIEVRRWFLFGETVIYHMPYGALLGYSYMGDISATSLFRLPDNATAALLGLLDQDKLESAAFSRKTG